VRNDVEGDLLGELPGRRAVIDEDAFGLGPELVLPLLAGTRDGLIGFMATTSCAVEQLGLAMMFLRLFCAI
jgi:hypothetical protein